MNGLPDLSSHVGAIARGWRWLRAQHTIWRTKRQFRNQSLAAVHGAQANGLCLIGTPPASWGQWSPQTLDLLERPANVTWMETAVLVPTPVPADARKVQGAPPSPAETLRMAGLEITDSKGRRFLACWLRSDGGWSVEHPLDSANYPKSGPANTFAGNDWHTIRIRSHKGNTVVYIDGQKLAEDVARLPLQLHVAARVTSPHVRPKAFYRRFRAWYDPRESGDY